jgi:formiminotetrahydrofolate cyclodeaminase
VSLLDLAARALLDRFASPEPTPGGGSAAALAGALGAGLVAMVCAMEKTRSGVPSERQRLDEATPRAREAGERLRRLVDEDTSAYDAVVAAYRLPKATDEQKAARNDEIARAMQRATEVPRQTARACLEVMALAAEAAAHGNPNALSDARTGAALAWAGLQGAVENVRINLGADPPPAALAEIEATLREGRDLLAAVGVGPT